MSEFIFKPFSKEQLDQLDCIIRAMKPRMASTSVTKNWL